MLRRLLHLLFGLEHPTVRRIMACEDVVAAVDKRVDNHYRELKELRGRINGMRRWEKAAEDDAGATIAETPDIDSHPRRRDPVTSTAHLSRRFRSS